MVNIQGSKILITLSFILQSDLRLRDWENKLPKFSKKLMFQINPLVSGVHTLNKSTTLMLLTPWYAYFCVRITR